ncbi:MAG: 3-phosphoshikimate 1-carboxyvinyltransferase [Planctomycetia bacterium TMED53]|nr:MAG: 3-phosphoshikimate 1-carboxyvinyltransferase [Planctomycetia bacterium TMED53]
MYDSDMENPAAKDDYWQAPEALCLKGRISVQGSKSVAQRVLFNAFLATGESVIAGAPDCGDVTVFCQALKVLGAQLETLESGEISITGPGPEWLEEAVELNLESNGTAMRFLTALCAMRQGVTILKGETHRPVGPLVKALRKLGTRIDYLDQEGYLPLEIQGGPISGGRVVLQSALSSQFSSALMLLAPHTEKGLQVRLVGPVSSRPYIDLTAYVLKAFGVKLEVGVRDLHIQPSAGLKNGRISIEADASAAAFPLCGAAITGGEVTVEGVGLKTLQGDRRVAELLKEMGCDVTISENSISVSGKAHKPLSCAMEEVPDLVPPLAVVAAFSRGESIFSGVSHLKVKESDRLQVLCQGMRSLGIKAECQGDLLRVVGSDGAHMVAADLDPAGDHRMAMAFALLALKIRGVRVLDPQCVGKSDPEFFRRLESLLEPFENQPGELSFE